MPLAEIHLTPSEQDLPSSVAQFLQFAEKRLVLLAEDQPKRDVGFVPSNYLSVCRYLVGILESNLCNGNSLCEWGSGLGVVTCLASLLGFDACGIEIDTDLVSESQHLATKHSTSAKFIHGSFIPPGGERHAKEAFEDNAQRYPWLSVEEDDTYTRLGMPFDSFDIVFAYPWPGEDYFIERLFEDNAANGALLLTYHDTGSLKIRRKVAVSLV